MYQKTFTMTDLVVKDGLQRKKTDAGDRLLRLRCLERDSQRPNQGSSTTVIFVNHCTASILYTTFPLNPATKTNYYLRKEGRFQAKI